MIGRNTLALVAALVLVAYSLPSSAKVKLAVMELKANGVESSVAQTLTELLTADINETGMFTVISSQDIKSMLDFEQDRRLAGCEADAACMAEIGGALGVEYVVSGSVGKLGEMNVINLQLLDIQHAKVESRVKRTLPASDQARAIEEMKKAAHALVRPLRKGNMGFISLECNEEGASVYVDERLIGTTPLPARKPLSGGLHELVLKKEGFVEWASEVDIRPGQLLKSSVVMIPSQEYIRKYEARAKPIRSLAWGTAALALASAAGSGAFYYLASDKSERSTELHSDILSASATEREAMVAELDQVNQDGRTWYALYWVLMGTAVLSAGTSATLFMLGDPPDKYEGFQQGQSVALTVVPDLDLGGLSLCGTF